MIDKKLGDETQTFLCLKRISIAELEEVVNVMDRGKFLELLGDDAKKKEFLESYSWTIEELDNYYRNPCEERYDMKLYIPQLGDRLQLTADWTFDLYNDERNHSLMLVTGDMRDVRSKWQTGATSVSATIPAGAILKVDRIYIRKGQEDFDSITFYWEGMRSQATMRQCPYRATRMDKVPAKAVRFWVKMNDANKIEFEFPPV